MKIIAEYRTEEKHLLFRVVSVEGKQYISIKHHGSPKIYYVPVNILEKEASVIEIAPDDSG